MALKILLLGYMSSGKSSVGKALASELNSTFVDLDEHVSAKVGMPVPLIFSTKGELFFRKVEHKCLEELLASPKDKSKIIALGGGTPCYFNNMELIKESKQSLSFYLKANLETLLSRLWNEKENRPLISHYQDKNGLEEFIRKHLFERQFYYLQANFSVDTSTLNINQTVEAIQQKIK